MIFIEVPKGSTADTSLDKEVIRSSFAMDNVPDVVFYSYYVTGDAYGVLMARKNGLWGAYSLYHCHCCPPRPWHDFDHFQYEYDNLASLHDATMAVIQNPHVLSAAKFYEANCE